MSQKIVTAGHCCDGLGIEEARITVGDYTVEDGDQDGTEQIFKISSMKMHEMFDMDTIDYDVCILTVCNSNLYLLIINSIHSNFSKIFIIHLVGWCY